MTKEEFIELVEDELDELDTAVCDEAERNHIVNGFCESYTQPSAAACSNMLQVVSNNEGERGTNLLITALQESNGVCQVYIVSLVNMETFETEERKVVESWEDVTTFAVKKWFDIHYRADKEYEWHFKDGKYEEEVFND